MCSQSKNETVTIMLDDFIITVDENTATAIQNDPELRATYLESIKEQISVPNVQVNKDIIWKTAKSKDVRDKDATLTFFSLRKQYDNEFQDKKTCKNIIWTKIASTMNEMGFYVGDGVDGREKCRQKFANLQSAYIKTVDKRRQTGDGKIADPLFFEEMSAILGDKHKVNPALVIDTIDIQQSSSSASLDCINDSTASSFISDNTPSTSQGSNKSSTHRDPCTNKTMNTPSTSYSNSDKNENGGSTSSNHRFMRVNKSARAKKDATLESIINMNKENLENRKVEFQTLMNMMQEQNMQRHNQIMALINSNRKKKSKKRTYSSSEDE